eukprot:SAG31_NODE_2228_length_6146_cov_4.401191_8_plen_115_part_00
MSTNCRDTIAWPPLAMIALARTTMGPTDRSQGGWSIKGGGGGGGGGGEGGGGLLLGSRHYSSARGLDLDNATPTDGTAALYTRKFSVQRVSGSLHRPAAPPPAGHLKQGRAYQA